MATKQAELPMEPVDAEPVPDEPKALAMLGGQGISREQFEGYLGASSLKISAEEDARLAQVLPDEAHDILPSGEVYVAQVHVRRILNETFGRGQWALIPRGGFNMQDKTMMREYALVVRGHFVSEAVGEQDYIASNDRMSYATATEGCRSNALVRCSKDLGVASECWDRRWTERWKKEHAIRVWVKLKGGESKPMWRRRDADPLPYETGPVIERNAAPQAEQRPAEQKAEATSGVGVGPFITKEQLQELYRQANAFGIAKKADILPIASKVCGYPVPQCGAIPQTKFGDVMKALGATEDE